MVLVVGEATLQWIHIFENLCGVFFDHILAALRLAVIDQNLVALRSVKGQNFVLASALCHSWLIMQLIVVLAALRCAKFVPRVSCCATKLTTSQTGARLCWPKVRRQRSHVVMQQQSSPLCRYAIYLIHCCSRRPGVLNLRFGYHTKCWGQIYLTLANDAPTSGKW